VGSLYLEKFYIILGFQVEIGFRANNKKMSDIGMMGCFHKGINNWFLTIKKEKKTFKKYRCLSTNCTEIFPRTI
jgi:hypothetical protein